MKTFLKNILVWILGGQIRRLCRRHHFKIIGVVGSIGKTSTKIAIAKILQSERRVRYQEGNYNDTVSVPLVFFGHSIPSLRNIFAWALILLKNEYQILGDYPFDVVVLELGTDGPNQIGQFRRFLHLDIAVLTAVSPEHMEFFKTLENVADEEWSVSFFSDLIFANRDLCKMVPDNLDHKKIIFYGKDLGSSYKMENIERNVSGFNFDISREGKKLISLSYGAISEVELYTITASFVVASQFGLKETSFKEAIKKISGFPGRMQKLKGIKKSIIIDDTYNASPVAMKIALDTLYNFPGQPKVAS